MGNVLLARILEYFNGTLFLDDNYRFCVFFIENYIDFYKMTLEEVVEKSKISKEAILNFLSHLGFDDYASFQDKLYADVILRQDQIRSRMLGLKMDDLFKQVHLCDDKEKFIEDLDHICHDISTSKRVVIIGALYPISIAVEFQTDLILLESLFSNIILLIHNWISIKMIMLYLFRPQEELMMLS